MGLSILIPVYNFNVTSLVQALAGQLARLETGAEIILLDDGSDASFLPLNKPLQSVASISFFQNEKNEGRMATRLKLATLAQYEYLLFLDCDSMIIKDDFLAAYSDLMTRNVVLASGGRVYAETFPADCDLMLHWKYGTIRESRRTKKKDSKAFMSNNFLIKKELFGQIGNSLELTGYGHEDSWWGIQFEQLGINCHLIDNPVLHADIEKAVVFLDKSENALKNILLLSKTIDNNLLRKHIKIFRWYARLRNTGFSGVYIFFEKPFHNYFRRNLLSCKPNLFFFDCYRLAVLVRMGRSKSGE
ncbi:MAG: glycosyltransferase [Chitinophagaceae bacterium]